MNDTLPRVTASAPGKLMLAGEYAVLRDSPALLVAMNCRATATLAVEPQLLSLFLAEAATLIGQRFGPSALEVAKRVVVDSMQFYRGSQKLGFGSSAAATVSAIACIVAALDEQVPPALVLELATQAHHRAQQSLGAAGSGADIAAAVYGGVVCFCRSEAPEIIAALPDELVILPFFVGQSASTAELVRQVTTSSGANLAQALDQLALCGAQACAASRAGDAPGLLAALQRDAAAVHELGVTAGIDLETQAIRDIRAALSSSLVVKTTGAGGGDIGVIVGFRKDFATDPTPAVVQAGCHVLPFSLTPTGIDISLQPR